MAEGGPEVVACVGGSAVERGLAAAAGAHLHKNDTVRPADACRLVGRAVVEGETVVEDGAAGFDLGDVHLALGDQCVDVL